MSEQTSHTLLEIANEAFADLCSKRSFLAGLLIGLGEAVGEFESVLAALMPVAPFRGSERGAVGEILEDCHRRHPLPHVHNVGALQICNIARKHGKWSEESKRVWYHPFTLGGRRLVFLGFLKQGEPTEDLKAIESPLKKVATLLIYERDLSDAKETLAATENFVREVGHDFAGSVQAILAKVNTLRNGGLNSEATSRKLDEIETEILSAYSQAEQLGITIDRDYRKRDESSVDLEVVVADAIRRLDAEAKERKISFNYAHTHGKASCHVWGDPSALLVCTVQLLHNAVKYAFGSSRIDVLFTGDQEFVTLNISNLGHPLPKGADERKIWDLGFRGEEAKGLHVNGSGVGLFTVNKIVKAHFGSCSANHYQGKTVFTVSFPRKNLMKHKVGVLI